MDITWKIIDKYFKDNTHCLVRHHLETYNDFFDEGIQSIFREKNPIKIIGTRHGEKLYESLISREEMVRAEDLGLWYRIPSDSRDLNYEKYFDKGLKSNAPEEFNSFNANRLTDDELANLLSSIGYN